jgi:hypothetical protein
MVRAMKWVVMLPMLAGACVAPVGPVSVTRFHVAELPAPRGPIRVAAAPGVDPAGLEIRSYESAVAGELARLGYAVVPVDAPAGPDGAVAEVRVEREQDVAAARGSPVRVGLGGATGSYGSGVGLGFSFPLGRPPAPPVTTTLSVRISAAGRAQWEGRASFTVAATSPLAGTQLAAPKLAAALFAGFPGNSGETIEVR